NWARLPGNGAQGSPMSSSVRRAALSAAVLLALASAASAQGNGGGNGYYDVAVLLTGEYTARTGNLHIQPRANIFYGGTPLSPGTTWNSVRSYRSNREWVLLDTAFGQPVASTGFTCDDINHEDRPTSAYLRDSSDVITGVQTKWVIRSGVDDLEVTQEVNAEGVTQDTSV